MGTDVPEETNFPGGAFAHVLRFAVAPDARRKNRLVAGVNMVADGLAGEVGGNRPEFQPVPGKQREAFRAIVLILRANDIEMIAPAGEFEAVVAEVPRLLRDGFERQIGPLAGEQGYGTRHKMSNDSFVRAVRVNLGKCRPAWQEVCGELLRVRLLIGGKRRRKAERTLALIPVPHAERRRNGLRVS